MEITSIIALTLGVSWASGINLYASVLTLGILGVTGNVVLPQELQVTMNPWVIAIAAFMYVVEFIADKIPGFDSVWDLAHTFIRIPAGAALAAAALGPVDPVITAMAVLVGGVVSGGSHGIKMSTRLAINSSPEPLSNWSASLTEDVAVVLGVYTALHHPVLFLLILTLFMVLVIWFLPKLIRVIKSALARVLRFFHSGKTAAERS